jgi:hypothetical protein
MASWWDNQSSGIYVHHNWGYFRPIDRRFLSNSDVGPTLLRWLSRAPNVLDYSVCSSNTSPYFTARSTSCFLFAGSPEVVLRLTSFFQAITIDISGADRYSMLRISRLLIFYFWFFWCTCHLSRLLIRKSLNSLGLSMGFFWTGSPVAKGSLFDRISIRWSIDTTFWMPFHPPIIQKFEPGTVERGNLSHWDNFGGGVPRVQETVSRAQRGRVSPSMRMKSRLAGRNLHRAFSLAGDRPRGKPRLEIELTWESVIFRLRLVNFSNEDGWYFHMKKSRKVGVLADSPYISVVPPCFYCYHYHFQSLWDSFDWISIWCIFTEIFVRTWRVRFSGV